MYIHNQSYPNKLWDEVELLFTNLLLEYPNMRDRLITLGTRPILRWFLNHDLLDQTTYYRSLIMAGVLLNRTFEPDEFQELMNENPEIHLGVAVSVFNRLRYYPYALNDEQFSVLFLQDFLIEIAFYRSPTQPTKAFEELCERYDFQDYSNAAQYGLLNALQVQVH